MLIVESVELLQVGPHLVGHPCGDELGTHDAVFWTSLINHAVDQFPE